MDKKPPRSVARPGLSPMLPGSPTLVEAPPDPTMTTQTALDAWEKKSAAIQAKLERSRAAPAGSPASEAPAPDGARRDLARSVSMKTHAVSSRDLGHQDLAGADDASDQASLRSVRTSASDAYSVVSAGTTASVGARSVSARLEDDGGELLTVKLRDKRTGKVTRTLRVPRDADVRAAVRAHLRAEPLAKPPPRLAQLAEKPPKRRGSTDPRRAPPKEYAWWHAELWLWRLAVLAVVAAVCAVAGFAISELRPEPAPAPAPAGLPCADRAAALERDLRRAEAAAAASAADADARLARARDDLARAERRGDDQGAALDLALGDLRAATAHLDAATATAADERGLRVAAEARLAASGAAPPRRRLPRVLGHVVRDVGLVGAASLLLPAPGPLSVAARARPPLKALLGVPVGGLAGAGVAAAVRRRGAAAVAAAPSLRGLVGHPAPPAAARRAHRSDADGAHRHRRERRPAISW